MGLFFNKQDRDEEENEPLHQGETIEMSESSSSRFNTTDFSKGWSSIVQPQPPQQQQQQQQARPSTHLDLEDPILPLPEINNELKRKLYLLLEEPASSRAAFWTNVIVSFLILFSAITTTIETIPSFRSAKSNKVWFQLESAMVALFTLEYLLRMFAHSDSFRMLRKFFLSPLSIIDFISIIPFYIEVIAKHDTTYEFRFTILRLFRLLRLFKSYKYSNAIVMTIEVMMMAFRRSGDALSALFFFTVTCVVLFSTLLYFAERGIWDETLQTFVASDGSPSSFDSIPAAFWFVLVTITTTGYGDMVPTTFIGKLITFPAMMFGVLLIALPSIIVGRNFTIVWESMRRRQFSNRMGLNPMGGEDVLDTPVTATATRTSVPGPETNFRILPNNEEEILNQIQQLLTLTLQNQSSIHKIMNVLENNNMNNNNNTNQRGKAPMQSNINRDDINPFEE